MKTLRKQLLISEWITKRVAKLSKRAGVSESEIYRLAAMLFLKKVDTSLLPGLMRTDYEHKIRKDIEDAKR